MYPVRNRTGADYFVAAECSRALTGVSSNHINGNGALPMSKSNKAPHRIGSVPDLSAVSRVFGPHCRGNE